MEKFFEVMEGPFGRVLRVALGAVLIYLGLARMSGTGGRILAIGWDFGARASCTSQLGV